METLSIKVTLYTNILKIIFITNVTFIKIMRIKYVSRLIYASRLT